MSILVDSSVWIDYFRDGKNSERLDHFIDENLIVTNDLILTELIPFLKKYCDSSAGVNEGMRPWVRQTEAHPALAVFLSNNGADAAG